MASYPTSIKSFSTKATNDIVEASHINDMQDEITAIETGLKTALQHNLLFTDATYDIGATGATRPRDIFLSRNATIGGTLTLGGIATGTAQPRARVYNSAVQSVNHDTLTALTWDTEFYDVGAMHSTASNTSRLTIPASGDGVYLVMCGAQFAADADGYRQILLRSGGATHIGLTKVMAVSATVLSLQAVALLNLVAGDYVEALIQHTAGAALDIGGDGGTYTYFSTTKVW